MWTPIRLNTIDPNWESNQAWFITRSGAIFAAWSLVYATAFAVHDAGTWQDVP
jgi:cytochrome bd-type quinol oxidase subunit 2